MQVYVCTYIFYRFLFALVFYCVKRFFIVMFLFLPSVFTFYFLFLPLLFLWCSQHIYTHTNFDILCLPFYETKKASKKTASCLTCKAKRNDSWPLQRKCFKLERYLFTIKEIT